MRCFLLLTIFFYHSYSNALIKPQAGLGFTDNANLEQSQKNNDFFLWARFLGLHSFDAWDTDLWVNVKDYQTQNDNDAFQWRFDLSHPLNGDTSGDLNGSFSFGQTKYVHGSPTSTDTSYNNTYLQIGLDSSVDLGRRPLDWDFAFKNTHFPDFANRSDRELKGSLTVDPFSTELGFVNSTDSYFSRTYLGMDFDWPFSLPDQWKTELAISLRYSYFPDRKIYQTVQTKNKKTGSIQQTTQEENESQMLLQISPSISKLYGRTEVKLAINLSSQNSRSQLADYFETLLLASVQSTF